MYHDTIHINFKYNQINDIAFDYSFLISKHNQDKFSPIVYGELLQKFEEIGFNLKYLKFYDIYDNDTMVYCTYNYQPNFNVFFSAYRKLMQNKNFNISFEYGIIIGGKFYPNNMNYFASIHFISENKWGRAKSLLDLGTDTESIIQGKKHYKVGEFYQLVDKEGNIIHKELASVENDFEQHFFENYNVKVAMRKYKLNRLKFKFDDQETFLKSH
jgi:hypothetical protein